MAVLFLCSCLNVCDKIIDKNGNKVKIAHAFTNENEIIDKMKSAIQKYDNMLIIASSENNYEHTDSHAKILVDSFNLTMPFKNYTILDGRNANNAQELIKKADFIYLSGGHLPTQNKFFQNIKLKDLLSKKGKVIMGCSAGAMNMAETVYCPPELEGEGKDKNFQRYFEGLGLVNFNIFPHYDELKGSEVDGLNYLEDIIKPDSCKKPIICLNNGSYICVDPFKKTKIYGEAYLVWGGVERQICSNDKYLKFNYKNDQEIVIKL